MAKSALREIPAFGSAGFPPVTCTQTALQSHPGALTVVPVVLRQRGCVVKVGGVPPELSRFAVIHGDGVLWRTHTSLLPAGATAPAEVPTLPTLQQTEPLYIMCSVQAISGKQKGHVDGN